MTLLASPALWPWRTNGPGALENMQHPAQLWIIKSFSWYWSKHHVYVPLAFRGRLSCFMWCIDIPTANAWIFRYIGTFQHFCSKCWISYQMEFANLKYICLNQNNHWTIIIHRISSYVPSLVMQWFYELTFKRILVCQQPPVILMLRKIVLGTLY